MAYPLYGVWTAEVSGRLEDSEAIGGVASGFYLTSNVIEAQKLSQSTSGDSEGNI